MEALPLCFSTWHLGFIGVYLFFLLLVKNLKIFFHLLSIIAKAIKFFVSQELHKLYTKVRYLLLYNTGDKPIMLVLTFKHLWIIIIVFFQRVISFKMFSLILTFYLFTLFCFWHYTHRGHILFWLQIIPFFHSWRNISRRIALEQLREPRKNAKLKKEVGLRLPQMMTDSLQRTWASHSFSQIICLRLVLWLPKQHNHSWKRVMPV